MNPIAPKISWEKLNKIEKFLWLTPFLGKHRENYKNASSILKTRPEFPVQEWDSFTNTEAIESFLLTIRDVLKYPNHHFTPNDELDGFLSSSHFGMIDGFELETIADEFEEISGEGFPEEDYSRFTLGELLKSFRKKKIKR